MDLYSFIIDIIGICSSLFSRSLSYWSLISNPSGLWLLSVEQQWMVALDSFTSMCWILYALYDHHVSWFLFGGNIPVLILVLLCFITSTFYQLRGSQFHGLALHTKIALGAAPLIFIVVRLLWSFDVVSRVCFAIFAILAGTSSSILTIVQLWHNPTSGDWKMTLQSILGLVSGALELLMGIRRHHILFLINSAVVFIFGLVQFGVAFFVHENHSIPWFSHGASSPLPS